MLTLSAKVPASSQHTPWEEKVIPDSFLYAVIVRRFLTMICYLPICQSVAIHLVTVTFITGCARRNCTGLLVPKYLVYREEGEERPLVS